jgi:flavoprotein
MESTVRLMLKMQEEYDLDITVASSKNGKKVAHIYEVWEQMKRGVKEVLVEKGPNEPWLAGPLQMGKYDVFLVCPATANTTAKIAHGIADTLISNCVSQALKAKREVYVYPVDQKPGETTTILPGGRELTLTIRRIDLENARKLKRMRGITVLSQLGDIKDTIERHLDKLSAS